MGVFRKPPPWTLILEVFSLLNLSSDFPTTFTKNDLKVENFSAAAGLLEPYYLPCKVKLYLEYTDSVRWITIIRHILAVHGYTIKNIETTRNKKKVIFYTIERLSDLRTAVSIDFS